MNVLKKELQVYVYDKKVRGGSNHDGGYVYADMGPIYDCYISAGVANEESFSKHFIEKHGMNYSNSFAFDGTILQYPHQYTDDISFIRKNIGASETTTTTDFSSLIEKYNNVFLKMDVEGGEYSWIATTRYLHKFSQMVIEFHGINSNDEVTSRFFQKINQTHYLVHAHGNVCGGISTNGLPHVIELTYVNKKFFLNPPLKYTGTFPQDPLLDQSNDPNMADVPFTLGENAS